MVQYQDSILIKSLLNIVLVLLLSCFLFSSYAVAKFCFNQKVINEKNNANQTSTK